MLVDLLALGLLWVAGILIVNPMGNFPLNDDWAMGQTVKRLVEGQGYHPIGWTEMSLITHVLWGALFCLPHGFSFNALRCSTLVFSLAGVFAMYALIRHLRPSRTFAFICAVTLAFNPIFFALSNTFMTDVPFTTLVILSALFFVRYLQNEDHADLVLATVFTIAATLCRQLGLCLPLAFAMSFFLKQKRQKSSILPAVLPLITTSCILVAFQLWLKLTGRLPTINIQRGRLLTIISHPIRAPINVAYFGWAMLMYLGWFLLPVLVLSNERLKNRTPRARAFVRVILGLFIVASIVRFLIIPHLSRFAEFGVKTLMPVHNNILIPQGIGPASLHDTAILRLPNLPALPTAFWLVVTILSIIGAGMLLVKIANLISDSVRPDTFAQTPPQNVVPVFFLLVALIYLFPWLLSGFFDRYLLPITAFCAAFLAIYVAPVKAPSRRRFVVAVGLIAGFWIFSVATTRDYLQWNRTRWKAIDDLLAQKDIKPKEVDGGFEYNGWYLYDTFSLTNWWIVNDTYTIAFGPMNGYEQVARYTYAHCLPPYEGQILVLKRKGQKNNE